LVLFVRKLGKRRGREGDEGERRDGESEHSGA
jgi:hypothetical protein